MKTKSSVLAPGRLHHLEMPRWMRGSVMETPVRRIVRTLKGIGLRAERKLRSGRAKCKLPSLRDWMWMDFDFAVTNELPHDDSMLEVLLGYLHETHVVYDVGSFVGSYAIPVAKRVQQGGVIAFEPTPETANLLRKHAALNGVADRVRIIEAACSKAGGMTSLIVWPTIATTWSSGSALQNVYPQDDREPDRLPVCAVTLDEFVQAGGPLPDIIKIDVEGGELWVLEGARQVLERARPIIFVELHAFAWRLFDTDEAALRSYIGEMGYGLFEIDPPHHPLCTIPNYGHAILRPLY